MNLKDIKMKEVKIFIKIIGDKLKITKCKMKKTLAPTLKTTCMETLEKDSFKKFTLSYASNYLLLPWYLYGR